jgi:hypothetical protein
MKVINSVAAHRMTVNIGLLIQNVATYNRSLDIAARQGINTIYDSRKIMLIKVGWLAGCL